METRLVAAPSRATALREVAALFLKLGIIGFGGPAAHIGLMEDEIVRRRQWLTRQEFLDLLGAVNLIPGPNSTEMAIHIGARRAGWPGLLVGGACFILPAAIIVSAIAWAYVRFGQLPSIQGLLYGVQPVIIAIILQALWGLGRSAVKTRWLGALGLAAMVLNLAGVHELIVLFAAGLLVAITRGVTKSGHAPAIIPPCATAAPGLLAVAAGSAASATTPFTLSALFFFFLKIGSVLFGSGYVLLAFLRADLVERWGWLSETQLIDAVAVGQVTPGPLFTTATFIGYLLGGMPAACLATIGIFLPAFFFVAISGPLIPRIRSTPAAAAVLDGINVASLALMAVVSWRLGVAAIRDIWTLVLAVVAAVLVMKFRVNSVWLVLGGALVGLGCKLLLPTANLLN